MINLETFLENFYHELRQEYNEEEQRLPGHHEALYRAYVSPENRDGLENGTGYIYVSKFCTPRGFNCGIRLWMDVYEYIEIYFQTEYNVDLRRYASYLVNDESFRQLVKVAFYIQDTIRPR